MIYDYRTAASEISSDDGVALHQDQYCAEEHCDLGAGDCNACSATRAGHRVCGYCGFLVRPSDLKKPCAKANKTARPSREQQKERMTMATAAHGRITTREPEIQRSLYARTAKLSKSDWIDLYWDLYRQTHGDTSTDGEIIADAERRQKILDNYRKAEKRS